MAPANASVLRFAPKGTLTRRVNFAFIGPTNSGKTHSAFRMATGYARLAGGKIAVIDTDAERAAHEDEDFAFDHYILDPPHTPERFTQACEEIDKKGYAITVLDSMSDEYIGVGGLTEIAALGTSNNSAANWAEPKARHKKMMARLRQLRTQFLFCLRAEEKVELTGGSVRKLGFVEIQEKNFLFDVTAAVMFPPGAQGKGKIMKMTKRLRPFFRDDEQISEKHGEDLYRWAHAVPTTDDKVLRAAEETSAAKPAGIALADNWGEVVSTHATGGEWLVAYRALMQSATDDEARTWIATNNLPVLRKLGPKSDDAAAELRLVPEHLAEPASAAA